MNFNARANVPGHAPLELGRHTIDKRTESTITRWGRWG